MRPNEEGKFLVSASDFAGNQIMSGFAFLCLLVVAILGNYFFGFGFYLTFPHETLGRLQEFPLFSLRLASYASIGSVSAYFYLGSFFSVLLFPLVFFFTGRSRFLRRHENLTNGKFFRSVIFSGFTLMLMWFVYISHFSLDGEDYTPFAFLMFFPFFPTFAAVSCIFLAFPAMQILAIYKRSGTDK